MKRSILLLTALLIAASFSPSAPAQTSSSSATHKAKKTHNPTLQEQVLDLQKKLQEQGDKFQQELESLKAELSAKQNEAVSAPQTAEAAQKKADTAQAQATEAAQQNMVALQSLRTTVETQAARVQTTIAEVQTQQVELKKQVEEPIALRYKGVTLTPGGFLAGESVWRQRAMNADIYTNFNATPYPGNAEAHTSEWVPSARQSRLSLLANGKVPFGVIKGYFEGDFLSAGTTSNSLQSNSYTLRVRQAWAELDSGHFVLDAGQMWTLLTEDKKGALAGQEALPLFFDGNLHVGYTYVRQMGYRMQDMIAPGVTLAISLENSQYQFSAQNAPTNFFFGAAGAQGGLNNQTANYTNQVAPDVLAKVSFDPGFGHFELGGIARFFRDRYYPNAPAVGGTINNTKLGGGFVANARFKPTEKAEIGFHLVGGDGTGRYGASILPDITVKPDGTLEPLRNAQALFSLELHPAKKFDVFGYAGTEYVQRTYYGTPGTGVLVGYGVPSANNTGCETEIAPTGSTGYLPGSGTCTGVTKNITQGSAGFLYRPYSGPAGKLQFGAAYSYLTRTGWYGVGGSPKAVNNMVYTSMRYYLP
jgi:hypothetical protein